MKKNIYLIFMLSAVLLLSIIGCRWELDNPSDSVSSDFTEKSEASIVIKSKQPFFKGDTILVWGGVTSDPVEAAGMVREYQWDYGDDGTIDTTLDASAELMVPLTASGQFTIAIKLVDRAGYTSDKHVSVTVQPRKSDDTLADTVSRPDTVVVGDTATTHDTTRTDDTTVAQDTTTVAPFETIFTGLDIDIDSSCVFYAQSGHTMKPVVLMGRYFSYRNKAESMSLGSFVFELLKNLAGTIDYTTLGAPFTYSFNRGVYTFDNGNLSMQGVFHYGSTVEGQHNEDDTVQYDVFNPRSYIKSFSPALRDPYYTYEKGPLWSLTSGFTVNVSNPLNPKMSMNIELGELKFSAFREVKSRYTLTAELDDSNQISVSRFDLIPLNYHGLARIAPFHIRTINSIVAHDSLGIDMSESAIESDSFPVTFAIPAGDTVSTSTYDFYILQEMISQQVWFGNGGGNFSVHGDYTARSQVSVKEFSLVNSYFSGVYSTSAADSALFYCDEGLQKEFGVLRFATPQDGFLTFVSERFSYQFTIREGSVSQ